MPTCTIAGCTRPIMYKSRGICQMHYFRFMRNGTYETILSRRYRVNHSHGYIKLYEPSCPLSDKGGYVYEHRFVIYGIYGDNLPDCAKCGKSSSWEPYFTHIDHIDCDKSNNSPNNLRVLCNACNVGRSKVPQHVRKNNTAITWMGETKTASEWVRDRRCSVGSGTTIVRRIQDGMDVGTAITTPSRTFRAQKARELEKQLKNS